MPRRSRRDAAAADVAVAEDVWLWRGGGGGAERNRGIGGYLSELHATGCAPLLKISVGGGIQNDWSQSLRSYEEISSPGQ